MWNEAIILVCFVSLETDGGGILEREETRRCFLNRPIVQQRPFQVFTISIIHTRIH